MGFFGQREQLCRRQNTARKRLNTFLCALYVFARDSHDMEQNFFNETGLEMLGLLNTHRS